MTPRNFTEYSGKPVLLTEDRVSRSRAEHPAGKQVIPPKDLGSEPEDLKASRPRDRYLLKVCAITVGLCYIAVVVLVLVSA